MNIIKGVAFAQLLSNHFSVIGVKPSAALKVNLFSVFITRDATVEQNFFRVRERLLFTTFILTRLIG